ncbi:hypothetical protein BHE74_00039920 [Ensete ventricosum]|nr:hypothetical protein BHE74_00039920 [Ensete ventricosum]
MVYPPVLGESTTESTQIPGYGQSNRPAWVGQPPSAARKPGRWRYTRSSPAVYPLEFPQSRPNSRQSGSLRHFYDESYGLLPTISRHVLSELLDPFDESPSELQRDPTTSSEPRPDAQA